MPFEPPEKAPRTPQAAAFHVSNLAAWAAIGFVWSITPLAWCYVAWTLLTLIPALQPGRPAPIHLSLEILHYLTLSYCILEIPFSIYYRALAIQANRRRTTPQYTRRFLRSVLKRSLENGLSPEQIEDEVMDEMGMGELTRKLSRSISKEEHEMHELRHRKSNLGGDGSATPEITSSRQLEPERLDDDEGYGQSVRSTTGAHRKPSYSPSFIEKPLSHDDPRAADFRNFIRLWFNGCDYEEIKRLNMADWLAWSLYGQPLTELEDERAAWDKAGRPALHLDGEPDIDDEGLEITQDKLGLVEHCIELVEARAAVPFKPGRNSSVKTIRLTLDPVKAYQRPLVLYCFAFSIQRILTWKMRANGFKEIKDGDCRYLVRLPSGWVPKRDSAEANRPLLFVHGLGIGIPQYATLVSYLAKAKTLKDRPIAILIQPHISMSFFAKNYLNPPNEQTSCAGIERMAKRWGFDKSGLTVLSHSNGTIVHGWLLKNHPELVLRSCFVDPVCFCLWEPWVCYNFLYSKPKTAIEFLMRYFVSRELGVALMLQRTFDWSSNLLFPTEIPNLKSPYRAAFYLAGRDSILNAERVRRYLRQHGVKEVRSGQNVGPGRGGLKMHAGKKHGESMIGSGLAFNQIMEWVTLEESEDALVEGESSACDSVQ